MKCSAGIWPPEEGLLRLGFEGAEQEAAGARREIALDPILPATLKDDFQSGITFTNSGRLLLAASALLIMTQGKASDLESTVYGRLNDGREVKIFTLKNPAGMTARVMEYGATLVSLTAPDRNGRFADVTLGYDTLDRWLTNSSYFGATVGRFGNRIAHGKFTLDGREHALATNNAPNGVPCSLHGGNRGFDKVLWHGEPIRKAGARGVALTYASSDGEEGFPGTVHVRVTYWLTDANEMVWEAEAAADEPTVVNLAQHTYWNLTGDPTRSIDDHALLIAADAWLPTDPGLIPTGERAPVTGTPMDFRAPTPVGARVAADFGPLKTAGGYDHCWVLRPGTGVRLAAEVRDPLSRRVMQVLTDQPGVQFYSGNGLDRSVAGKRGVKYGRRAGLCLETENFPDAPNHPDFPVAVLRPGQTYRHTMVCRFSAS